MSCTLKACKNFIAFLSSPKKEIITEGAAGMTAAVATFAINIPARPANTALMM